MIALLLVLALAGCGGGDGDAVTDDGSAGRPDAGGGGEPVPPDTPNPDELLRELAASELGLTGDPATPRGLSRTAPNDDPMVKLGQLLFFSETLAAGFDSACASCHHPDFAGSDALSLSVGVVPHDASVIGPERRVDDARDLDPRADGGPNMPRNSLTTFNAPFFDRAQMFDGRVFVLDQEVVPGGRGQDIRTPESGNTPDTTAADGLLELAAKLPMVTDNEMRGFLYTDIPTAVQYRQHLMARLRGEVDTEYLDTGAASKWLVRFRAAFGDSGGSAADLITMPNVQQALAAYIESGIFVDTPWRAYLEGDNQSLSDDARHGAMLFLESPAEGGLGCASCHAGDKFSDERFYNIGFPQIGRGFRRVDGQDRGRWSQTRAAEDFVCRAC